MPVGSVPGWTQVYTQDFAGMSIPSGWGTYAGTPGGESPSVAGWNPSMCSVSGGELHFMADGIHSCGVSIYGSPQTYGAYLVRMKGDAEPSTMLFSDIALLWPADNSWSAEIDFYEDNGASRSQYNASMYACPNGTCHYEAPGIQNNGTQWHTYGVAWTPTSVTYTVDGRTVAQFDAAPQVPMVLDLQSQNLAGAGAPAERETMAVAWVAEYAYTPGTS
jgi:hypothetical protein